MPKKPAPLIAIISIAAIAVIAAAALKGNRPFARLTAEGIAAATVALRPTYPGQNAPRALSEAEIAELAALLRDVVTYNRSWAYTQYAGQAVVFTITKADGSQTEVNAFNPFIIIDGKGYKTKHDPCEALNSLGNALLR